MNQAPKLLQGLRGRAGLRSKADGKRCLRLRDLEVFKCTAGLVLGQSEGVPFLCVCLSYLVRSVPVDGVVDRTFSIPEATYFSNRSWKLEVLPFSVQNLLLLEPVCTGAGTSTGCSTSITSTTSARWAGVIREASLFPVEFSRATLSLSVDFISGSGRSAVKELVMWRLPVSEFKIANTQQGQPDCTSHFRTSLVMIPCSEVLKGT